MSSNSTPGGDQDILDAKPLRSLAPMFPAPFGVNAYHQSTAPPFVCVTPIGEFTAGFDSKNAPPLTMFTTLSSQEAGGAGPSNANGPSNGPILATPISSIKTQPSGVIEVDEDGEMLYSGNQTTSSGRQIKRPSHLGGYNVSGSGTNGSGGTKAKRPKRKPVAVNELALLPADSSAPRETVEVILMTFDALRRRHLQLDEVQETSKRADLKAGAIMMSNNIRANMGKMIGAVPGVEIGDIFYFRMELCVIGLHSPSMGGIDYMTTRFEDKDDPVAICVVSSGGYDNEDNDTDVLVYSGSGGGSKYEEKQDQKLERGNLALERSVYWKNEIRVVRGYKDPNSLTCKVYVYDGLYKIQESWREKTKSGTSCFKYKLLRLPGQSDGAMVWKLTQQWIGNPQSREAIMIDLSAGAESIPVCLVNEVDNEKGPFDFTYLTKVKYLRPLGSMQELKGCRCASVCLPGDTQCLCAKHNGDDLPYNSSGLLVCRKPVIYECGRSCECSLNCRNRVTQKGVRIHFEVFKTTDRGWGLRSWDPIRAGTFICEYTGEVIDELKVYLDGDGGDDDYVFETACPGDKTLKWNHGSELLGEQSQYVTSDSFRPLSIKISSKCMGNVSRFMNHSCSPNVFWQPVQFDHGDDGHPHIMFFALKHIPPMTELTYDYGVPGDESNGAGTLHNCLCGSSNCRGYFR